MVEIILAQEKLNDFLCLIREYTSAISAEDSEVNQVLSSQNLNDELINVEKKYGLPTGRMYIAVSDGVIAGCVALTQNDSDYCELKRLYVRPQFRGQNIGQILTNQIISDAKKIGYKYIRLDTFPFMKSAIKLYENLGFYYIDKYNDNPATTAVFMELSL
mgnify:CR=1 FL=1